MDSLLGVEDERIVLDRAPLVVIGALGGMTQEALTAFARLRRDGKSVGDLSQLAATLSPPARDTLLAHYPELVVRTAASPEAWTLISRAPRVGPGISATIALRLVLSGTRAAVIRRRTDW